MGKIDFFPQVSLNTSCKLRASRQMNCKVLLVLFGIGARREVCGLPATLGILERVMRGKRERLPWGERVFVPQQEQS